MKKKMTASQLNNIKGKQFAKGQCGNPKGRPKNRINGLMKELLPKDRIRTLMQALTADEIATIERRLLHMELSELQLIAKWDKAPAYLKTLAMAIIIDMKNGRTATVEKLRDRQYGAVTQAVEVEANVSFAEMLMRTATLTDDEL